MYDFLQNKDERFKFFFFWCCGPTWARASSFMRFPDHTQRRTTVGRTPLDERSARRRDLYLTTHTTHNRQTSMPPVGIEPTISAGERPQLDRAATGTGKVFIYPDLNLCEHLKTLLKTGNVTFRRVRASIVAVYKQ